MHRSGGPDLYSIKRAHLIRGSHASPRLAHAASLRLPQKPAPSPRAALGTPDQCAQLLDSEWCQRVRGGRGRNAGGAAAAPALEFPLVGPSLRGAARPSGQSVKRREGRAPAIAEARLHPTPLWRLQSPQETATASGRGAGIRDQDSSLACTFWSQQLGNSCGPSQQIKERPG